MIHIFLRAITRNKISIFLWSLPHKSKVFLKLHQQLTPRHLPTTMKILLITFVLAFLTTFFVVSFVEGHEEELPATIPLSSFPHLFQMFENLPKQRRSAAPSESEPLQTLQTRYTQKNPWYYSAKRNNDVSRLAMRILKRSANHLGYDSEI